jgi:uncharacterized membrane protein YeaQ/YmgE (transglycosylase-associated protein family)
MGLPQKQFGGEVQMGRMDTRSLVIFLIIGIVAGFLAFLVLPGHGNILSFLVSGIIGSFVGGYLFAALNINVGIKSPILSQIITSTVGAIIVVAIARLITG